MAPLWLSIKLGILTTLVLLIVSIPLAYWLSFSKFKLKIFIEAIISLPFILPPTVLGFYLLVLLSKTSIPFTFFAILIGAVISSLPLMVGPIKSGFDQISTPIHDSCLLLGRGFWLNLRFVYLPLIRPSLVTGIVFTLAHTLGEFGIILMLGGNIEGSTKVTSIAIYDEVSSLNYFLANQYALILFGISASLLLILFYFRNKWEKY